ncbi:MAG: hybrid sensor histidine kinase/response regulator [Candidatus Brevundimonas colombiensis]|uniref:histidine kinase n=1 Tax=Candidatus Brevundimonas colombiensis TaxID=3121376 RepID=A0AAJ5WZL4_9CAUL|nr:hybrid sensor histidine kinase/response regulator [Brevundimonas sp.]WEK41336.1 MAG: hybrid sensor histidine kinase/response regulator [Brevundimonas sp.]
MDIVLWVLSLALSGTCAGIWLWLRALGAVEGLTRDRARLEHRLAQTAETQRQALSVVEAEVHRLSAEDAAKGEVIQALTRELRTPLTTIMGFTQLLRTHAEADRLTPRQSQGVRQIEGAGAVVLALIEEADDFVVSGDTRAAPFLQRVDLRLALRQVCDGLEPEARKAGVTLACPDAQPGLGVMADPVPVRRILRRLVANALSHSQPGATVRMTAARQGDRVTVDVHDPARPPEAATARPFQPLDGQDARGGTALGLGAAQRLAERMGGRLDAARDAWGATTFSFVLPVAGADPAARGRPQATALYVEDNPANVALMRQAAEALGLTLHAATTGPEGLELAHALGPDVILLDLGLPGMDGFEVKAGLDADPVTRDIPVLAVTAAGGPSDRRRGRAAGFDAYLTKPLDLNALADALSRVLSRPETGGGLDVDRRQRA